MSEEFRKALEKAMAELEAKEEKKDSTSKPTRRRSKQTFPRGKSKAPSKATL